MAKKGAKASAAAASSSAASAVALGKATVLGSFETKDEGQMVVVQFGKQRHQKRRTVSETPLFSPMF